MERSFKARLVSYDNIKDILRTETDFKPDASPPSDVGHNVSFDGVYELYPSNEFVAHQGNRRRIYNGHWAKSQFRLDHDFTPYDAKSAKLQMLHSKRKVDLRKKKQKIQMASVMRLNSRSVSPSLPRISPLRGGKQEKPRVSG